MSRYNAPLRYPGGKQKLTPFILEIMAENKLVGGHYAEPYAGGAGVAVEGTEAFFFSDDLELPSKSSISSMSTALQAFG